MSSTRHRSFATQAAREPITFDVDGEEFSAVADIPGGVLLDIAATLSKDGMPSVDGVTDFFTAAIVEEDHERFAKMIRREGGPGMSTLVEIVRFLVGEYTGFPTMTSPGSPSQVSRTGPGSSVRPRSRASTSKKSAQRKR